MSQIETRQSHEMEPMSGSTKALIVVAVLIMVWGIAWKWTQLHNRRKRRSFASDRSWLPLRTDSQPYSILMTKSWSSMFRSVSKDSQDTQDIQDTHRHPHNMNTYEYVQYLLKKPPSAMHIPNGPMTQYTTPYAGQARVMPPNPYKSVAMKPTRTTALEQCASIKVTLPKRAMTSINTPTVLLRGFSTKMKRVRIESPKMSITGSQAFIIGRQLDKQTESYDNIDTRQVLSPSSLYSQ